MKKLPHLLTKQKLEDQVTDKDLNLVKSPLLGTLLIVLSALILYADKLISLVNVNAQIPSRYENHFYDLETFVWMVGTTLSPLLLILASRLTSYGVAYVLPLYAYTLQLWFIVYDIKLVDKDYLAWYALGTSLLLVTIHKGYKKHQINKLRKEIQSIKDNL